MTNKSTAARARIYQKPVLTRGPVLTQVTAAQLSLQIM
jgi:hypothetical protein